MNELLQIGIGWFEVISLILNLVLGGSLIVTLNTLKAARKEAVANARKADAEADSSEIKNVDGVAKMWRDLAVEMSERQDELSKQVVTLSKEVRTLKIATNKVIRLLDRITPENLEEMVRKIKDEIEIEHTDISGDDSSLIRMQVEQTVDSSAD